MNRRLIGGPSAYRAEGQARSIDIATDPELHSYAGRCNVCGWQGVFVLKHRSIREGYACGQCRSSMRYRAQADVILALVDPAAPDLATLVDSPRWHDLQVFEPGIVGPFRKFMKGKPNYRLSFYWEDVPPGESRDGVVCQDLTATTYADGSFDMVITSDIFEHVRKPFDGFREIRRILKPGGWHVWSVPAVEPLRAETRDRMDTSTDEDIPILPPVYHGSGVAGGRSVVYTDFGADIVEQLAAAGCPTRLWRYHPSAEVQALVTFASTRA